MKNSKNVIITRADGSIKKIKLSNPQIVPESLVRINKHAFYECKCLINVKYPKYVVTEEMAFYGCTSLLIQK